MTGKLEVRDAKLRLIGWLEAPRLPRVGLTYSFAAPRRGPAGEPGVNERVAFVRLPLCQYLPNRDAPGYEGRLAFNSGDTPIEVLRRVTGFVEHTESQTNGDSHGEESREEEGR